MVLLILFLLLVAACAWFWTENQLKGESLERYDGEKLEPLNADTPPSSEHFAIVEEIQALFTGDMPTSGSRLEQIRTAMDTMGDQANLDGITITPVDVEGVPAEWVLAPNSDPQQRLLYIHGGAFTAGSPRSHRPVTTAFARRFGLSVLAIDYRLMPEHPRRAGIDDCHTAYRWTLTHGPDNYHRAERVFVAGDSAGGNLTLNTIAWCRDAGVRAPDGAIALSPATDGAFESPSLRENIATDPMLGPPLKRVVTAPAFLLLWVTYLNTRISPAHASVSPVRGELNDLCPLLIHASEAELLRDDAYRYFYRAKAAGSPVTLQTWEHMVHVWHIFEPRLPEAQVAFEQIEQFLAPLLKPAAPDQQVAAG